jgi:predicted enzyme related to lactoylglutathione lyase
MIRIAVTSVFVDDQSNALAFYTDVLGFEKKADIPIGEARWLTVVSPADPDGVELLLEPTGMEIAQAFKQGLRESETPTNVVLATDDIEAEHARLSGLGVVFVREPNRMGDTVQAVFDDTCGNLLLLVQVD